ncbi:MAG: cytochrome c oxidase assembly factor 1 family protein [Xanthomonadaceae bacterium]|nr:cytochrome c oxidase assembly factor 1 family protein [Xanthomonadaceae bacterium]
MEAQLEMGRAGHRPGRRRIALRRPDLADRGRHVRHDETTEPYRHAVQAAQADPRVVAALGEPINAGLFAFGNINVSGPSGQANLAIPLTGSRKSGTVYVEATKAADHWNYRLLEVSIDGDAQRIDLKGSE